MNGPCSTVRTSSSGLSWPSVTLSLACAASFSLQAIADSVTNAQVVNLHAELPVPPVEDNTLDVLIDRFSRQVTASDSFVFDRFTGPSSRLFWVQHQNRLGYDIFDRVNRAGTGLFETIGADSLRMAAVEALPLDAWEASWQKWLGNLISGSIGNVEEEHAQLASSSYSALRYSWETGTKDAGFQWGMRPWRTTPYVYFLTHAGHMDGEPLVTLETRAGYGITGSARMEGRVTLQLPASFRLAGGAAVNPSRLGMDEWGGPRFALTLERVLHPRGGNSDSVFFLGYRLGQAADLPTPRREALIMAGFSRSW